MFCKFRQRFLEFIYTRYREIETEKIDIVVVDFDFNQVFNRRVIQSADYLRYFECWGYIDRITDIWIVAYKISASVF